MKKHPVIFMLTTALTLVVLTLSIMALLQNFITLSTIKTVIVSVIGLVIPLILLIILMICFKKLMLIEAKTDREKLIKQVATKQPLVIVKKVSGLAVFGLTLGVLGVAVTFIMLPPIKQYSGIIFIVLRCASILLVAVGVIFTFFVRKPRIEFVNNVCIGYTIYGIEKFNPSEIVRVVAQTKYGVMIATPALSLDLKYLLIFLQNKKVLKFDKIGLEFIESIKQKLDYLKEYCSKQEESQE